MATTVQTTARSLFDVRVRVSHTVNLLLLALSIGPVLAVDIPAMLDYPNHLAVMSVLSRNGTAAANPFYQVSWAFNTNMAMELIVPQLARWIGLAAAGKMFLLLSQLLVIGGATAIERVVRGRLELSPLAMALFLYSLPFAWGFINFEFGLGVALCAIAAWLATEDRPLLARAAVHSIFVAILFVAHLLALGIYGVTLGIHELWRVRSGQATIKQMLFTMGALATPVVVIFGATLLLGHSVAGAASETEWLFNLKPRFFFEAMNGYSILLSSAGMGVISFGIFVLGRGGYLKLASSGLWIAIGFAILFVAMPNRLMDTALNDVRIVTAAALILPGFVQLSLPKPTWRHLVFWGASACALINLALVWWVWLSYRSEYAAMIASFGKIAKDSTVLVAVSYPPGKPAGNLVDYPLYHSPTLAVAYDNALVPSLFTSPGDRPVRLRSAYERFTQQGFLSPDFDALPEIAFGANKDAPEYLQYWGSRYDYLYVLGPQTPNLMPHLLHQVSSGPRFMLYHIDRSANAGQGPAVSNAPDQSP